ncbi:hypothetical protein TWF706_008299 [Orbilia oligospora]|nr:hypothetical protein TWF706_008299 [Orbilia oligospora]
MPIADWKRRWHIVQQMSAPDHQLFYPSIFDRTSHQPFKTATTRRRAVLQSIINFQSQSSWLTKLSDRTASIAWLDQEIETLITVYGTDDREKAEEERRKKENEPVWMPAEDVYDVLIGYKEYILQLREEGVSIEPDPTAVSVWKKDDVLDQETRKALIDAVTILKNTPYEIRGWGPLIPDSKAIDLLDPFMYPIILEGKVAKVVTRLINIGAKASREGEGDSYIGHDDTRCLDWHFDGATNELVTATVIYNCTTTITTTTTITSPSIPPSLRLRRRPPIPRHGPQFNDALISEPIFIKQNTALAFPNTYEYQLSTNSHPSTLLLFHLLDPFHPSPPPSTTTIPPQQQSQYLHSDLLRKSKIGTLLPEEIFQQILEYTQGNVISPEDAVRNRKLFMERRESQRDDIIRQY